MPTGKHCTINWSAFITTSYYFWEYLGELKEFKMCSVLSRESGYLLLQIKTIYI